MNTQLQLNKNLSHLIKMAGHELQNPPLINSESNYHLGELLYHCGCFHLTSENFNEAYNNFCAAVELQPDNYLYHHNAGQALSKSAKYNDAKSYFKTAIRLNKKSLTNKGQA